MVRHTCIKSSLVRAGLYGTEIAIDRSDKFSLVGESQRGFAFSEFM